MVDCGDTDNFTLLYFQPLVLHGHKWIHSYKESLMLFGSLVTSLKDILMISFWESNA